VHGYAVGLQWVVKQNSVIEKKKKMQWNPTRDSNPQSSAPEADAFVGDPLVCVRVEKIKSIGPAGLKSQSRVPRFADAREGRKIRYISP
jgi:hypothetical protein